MPQLLETFEPPTFDESFIEQPFAARAELDRYEKTKEANCDVPSKEPDREIPFDRGQMWSVRNITSPSWSITLAKSATSKRWTAASQCEVHRMATILASAVA